MKLSKAIQHWKVCAAYKLPIRLRIINVFHILVMQRIKAKEVVSEYV